MAVYGVSAYCALIHYDTSNDCKNYNFIGTGWDLKTAPDLHEYFRILEPGDLVYLKASSLGREITVKGIGVILGNDVISGKFGRTNVEIGREVKWLDKSHFKFCPLPGKNNARSNVIYRETHPGYITLIMKRLEGR